MLGGYSWAHTGEVPELEPRRGELLAEVCQALRAEQFFELRFSEQPVFKDQFRYTLAGGEGFLGYRSGRGVTQVGVERCDQAD